MKHVMLKLSKISVYFVLLMVVLFTASIFLYDGHSGIDEQHSQLNIPQGFELLGQDKLDADCYHDGKVGCSKIEYIYRSTNEASQELVPEAPANSDFIYRCDKAGQGYTLNVYPTSYYLYPEKRFSDYGDIESIQLLGILKC